MKKLIQILLILSALQTYGQSVEIKPNNEKLMISSYTENPIIIGRRSGFTSGVPTSTTANSTLLFLSGHGYSDGEFHTSGAASILFRANQNFSATARGSHILFQTTADNTTSVTERMRITHHGNVGIGNTTPNANAILDMSSTAKGILIPRMTTVQRNAIPTTTGLAVYDNTTKGFWFHDGVDWRPLNSSWITAEDSTYANTFTTIKAVGIGASPKNTGTGGVGGSVTNGRLQITGFNNGDQLSLIHPSSTVLKWGFYTSSIDSSLNFYYNGNLRARIDRVTGVYSTFSDRNLKKNIAGLSPVLDNVLKLNAYKYNYLNSENSDRKSIGFMAQDVLPYFPELVYHNKERETNEPFLMMDYSGLGVIAIKAIQEQQAIINNLQAQIDELRKLIVK